MKKLLHNPLVSTLILFSLMFWLIGPRGEFPVNDDWLFAGQVKAFWDHIFGINKLIEPSFIFQGLVGWAWISIFGFSFCSLRILTFLFSLAFLSGMYSLSAHFRVSPKVTTILLLTLAFNPVIFSSTLSFMTEMYFLATMVWGISPMTLPETVTMVH